MAGSEGRDTFTVEVAYALPEEQTLVTLEVEPGTTVEEAIRRSRILERHPEIDLERQKVGVFGKPASLGSPLRPKDRVEIYRPLKVDPKEMRRRRARESSG